MYKGIKTYSKALNGLIPGTKGPFPGIKGPFPGFKSLYNKLIVCVTEIVKV